MTNEANKQTEGITETQTNGNIKKGTSYDKKNKPGQTTCEPRTKFHK